MRTEDLTIPPRQIIGRILKSLEAFVIEGANENPSKLEKFRTDFKELHDFIEKIPGEDITSVLEIMRAKFPRDIKVIDVLSKELSEFQ